VAVAWGFIAADAAQAVLQSMESLGGRRPERASRRARAEPVFWSARLLGRQDHWDCEI
jgi:hypothetical protein